ncbi:MAG: phosphoribosylformylglycinamidine synthase subunit PurS [Bacteroidia bacterium]|nr:phosphoribosylformylglycinamidine synthase subunit PurS [Bacteroidia bacterium]
MKYTVEIDVMPHKNLLDPQGKAVANSMERIGLSTVHDVRIGKHITLQVDAENEEAAIGIAEKACKSLLVNPVMEYFEISINDD